MESRWRFVGLSLLLACGILAGTSVRAQSTAPEQIALRIERLIVELDHDDFDKRETAATELAQIGAAAEPALRRAAASGPSLEVRTRADDVLRLIRFKNRPVPLDVLSGHNKAVNMVAFSPDGETIASAGDEGVAMLWKWKKDKSRQVLSGHSGGLLFITYSPDGKTVATGGRDDKVLLWDATSGRNTGSIVDHTAAISAVTYSPDGELLATAGDDHVVKVRDKEGKLLFSLEGHKHQTAALAFAIDGKTLVSAGGIFNSPTKSGEVILWDLETKKPRWSAEGEFGGVWSLSVSPDGKYVVGGCLDRIVRVWDLASGKERFALRGNAVRDFLS